MSKKRGMKALALAIAICCSMGMAPSMTYAQNISTIGETANLTKTNTSVHLNVTEASIQVGAKLKLTVQNKPKNAQNVKWKSLNTKVATVNKNGLVTAKKAGTVKIQAKVQKKTLVCKVTVKQPKVQSITMEKTMLLTSGDEDTLVPVCKPAGSEVGKKITWKSDDTSVATVSGGNIKAKGAGITSVHASIDGKKASCQIGVLDDFEMDEDETLDLSLSEDQYYQLDVVFNGGEDSEEWQELIQNAGMEIEWESNDEDVVEVDADGCLMLNNEGEATITASLGDFEAECFVCVTSDYAEDDWASEDDDAWASEDDDDDYYDDDYYDDDDDYYDDDDDYYEDDDEDE